MFNLSLIITLYNSIRYARRITSYIEELPNDVQVIIIDDCSHDGTYEFFHELYHARINVVFYREQQNRGVAAARNRGIALAQAPLIAFADADDFVDSSALVRCINTIENDSGHDLYVCEYQTSYFQNGHIVLDRLELDDKECNPSNVLLNVNDFSASHTTRRAKYHICLSAWGKIYKTHVIRTSEIYFPEEFSKFEDCVFGLNYVYSSSSIRLISECFYTYSQIREPGTGLSNKFILEEWLDFIDKFQSALKKPLLNYPVTLQFISICLVGTMVRFLSICSLWDALTIRHRIAQYMNINFRRLRDIHVSPKGADSLVSHFFRLNFSLALYFYLRIKKLTVFGKESKPPFWCLSQTLS